MAGLHTGPLAQALVDDRLRETRARRPPCEVRGDLEWLVAAATRGDEAAWASLVDRFGARLRRLARAHRLSAEDAEDVVQSTFARLLDRIAALRNPRALPGWLETTVRHESVRVSRANARVLPTGDELCPALPALEAADDRLLAAERDATLQQALAELPERHRRLLAMLYCEREPSYEEISTALGVPVGSIGPTRARALARLRTSTRIAQLAGDGDA